ncbi:MAG TPA: hypothetical protein VLG91_21240, partial [Streptomyces sp.]|nr:hypothetical protein [Streptomyces sp.]
RAEALPPMALVDPETGDVEPGRPGVPDEAARERACRAVRLETWDFQAPEFYKRLGYEVVCVIPDYPPGITEYTLTKRIG